MSTNLHNLSHGHFSTLIGSAFVSDGGDIVAWLPGLVCLLALGELIWRSKGLLIAFAIGHIGATLLVAIWLTFAVKAGLLPISIAHATDVGVSYGAVSVLGALTASIPSRWRTAWIGWWLGSAVMVASSADFTAIGHVLALLLGIALSYRLRSIVRWTPLHVGLFVGGVTFGQLLPAGLRGYLPGTALQAAVTVHRSSGIITQGTAIVVLAIYAAITLAAAAMRAAHRDA